MRVFLDEDCRWHLSDDGKMESVETNAFDGKCKEYVEGCRFVPPGFAWTRKDGVIFSGPMIAPAVDHTLLLRFQERYSTLIYRNSMIHTISDSKKRGLVTAVGKVISIVTTYISRTKFRNEVTA